MNTAVDKFKPYSPTSEESKFIGAAYDDFQKDSVIKNQGLDWTQGITLQQMWDEADREFTVMFPTVEPDGWRKNWKSLVTQDKINSYLATIASDWIFPEVLAVNKESDIDRTISRVARGLLEYAEKNDGRPSTNGHMKFIQQMFTGLKYGTFHTQHDVLEGNPVKNVVPNEEIFIPNFYEPDIQKQGHLIRVQDGITYDEAKAIFGELPNWDCVRPGATKNWALGTTPMFRNYDSGIVKDDQVQIVRIWRPVPKSEITKGRRQKYYNVLINGVLMFDIKNKSIYKHGMYPMTKGICDMFDARCYWGKPLYLRFKSDKDAYDDFRSIVLNKAKLNLLPPMVSMNGLHVDQDVVVPGMITAITDDIGNLQRVPGVADAPDVASFQILSSLKNSIDVSATETLRPGNTPKQAARTSIIQEGNAQKMISILGLMAAFAVEAGAYLTVKNCFQFYPRKKIAKLVLPDQQLGNGRRGNYEVIFKQLPEMNPDDLLAMSSAIYRDEIEAKVNGEPMERFYIDPEYIDEMDLFIEVTANPIDRPSKAAEEARALNKYQLYAANQLVNQEENTRILIREMGDDEDTLLQQPMQQQGMMPQQLQVPNTTQLKQANMVVAPLPQLGQLAT